MYIDDKLRFQDHLTFLKNKLAQLCGITYRKTYKKNKFQKEVL